jgi:hypothetical protein
MNGRVFWFPMIAMLSLVGTSNIAPAFARGFGHGSGISASRSMSRVHGPRSLVRRNVTVLRRFVRSGVTESRVVARNADVTRDPEIGRHIDVQNDLRLRRRAQFENGLPFPIWPFWSYGDTAAAEIPEVGPSVIVMSDLPLGAQQRLVPDPAPDDSYIAGCHAIPGGYGYHCEAPHDATTAP